MSRIGRLPIDIPAKVKVEVKDRKVSVEGDRKSTRLNSSHSQISYAVLCLKKEKPSLNALADRASPVRPLRRLRNALLPFPPLIDFSHRNASPLTATSRPVPRACARRH